MHLKGIKALSRLFEPLDDGLLARHVGRRRVGEAGAFEIGHLADEGKGVTESARIVKTRCPPGDDLALATCSDCSAWAASAEPRSLNATNSANSPGGGLKRRWRACPFDSARLDPFVDLEGQLGEPDPLNRRFFGVSSFPRWTAFNPGSPP